MNSKTIAIGFGIVVLLVAGFVYLQNQQSNQQDVVTEKTEKVEMEASKGQEVETEYAGTVIAGSTTPYLDFVKADYEKAIAEGKVIVLNFYANWCPVCRAETPDIVAGFDSLNNPNVIAFRVNYKDSDTDADEEALAKQFAVPYQHTKVILKDGKQVFKETVQWSRDDLVREVSTAIEQ